MHDLFISYASENIDVVHELVKAFYRAGITHFWWDRSQIKLSDSIPHKIDEGIVDSRYLLAIVTKEYLSKYWTRQELDAIRTLQRPVIPVWVGVTATDVSNFSPALAARRAVEVLDDPEGVAFEVADLLMADPETLFAKFKDRREELKVFWGLALLFVRSALGVLEESEQRELTALDQRRPSNLPTWRQHMETELGYASAKIKAIRRKLQPLQDDDAALAITALIKRSGEVWFPTYSEEIAALKRAGIDTW